MQFTVASVLAFATAVVAQATTPDFNPVFTPGDHEVVKAGSLYEVTWGSPDKYDDEKISISLIGGATQDTLVPVADIVSGLDNSAEMYMWDVDETLGDAPLYGLVFRLVSNPAIFQYSMPFKIEKGDGSGDETDTRTHVTMTAPTNGVVTMTLSSRPPTTTAHPTTTHETPSETPEPTTAEQNTTMTYMTTVVSTTTTEDVEEPTQEAPTTLPTDDSAASSLGASSLALVGGLVVALFAL